MKKEVNTFVGLFVQAEVNVFIFVLIRSIENLEKKYSFKEAQYISQVVFVFID